MGFSQGFLYFCEGSVFRRKATPGDPKSVGFTEAPSKVFLLFFLFSDWLRSNHLRSRIERSFLSIFRAIFVAL